ncbi:UNVERIFIED_CONTAM: hypothetical protein PYX00_007540 [Menopon gallinae]|uniref:Kazal-like domain-containing protein n=1 Tax=Menopon gallinae TaxID=328185 RepID=A0AAW2HK38_9NEOP
MKLILLFALVAVFVYSIEGQKECQTMCTLEYDPVCARDHLNRHSQPVTFANKCAMNVASCMQNRQYEVLYEGECGREKDC